MLILILISQVGWAGFSAHAEFTHQMVDVPRGHTCPPYKFDIAVTLISSLPALPGSRASWWPLESIRLS